MIGIADGRPYGWDNLPEPGSSAVGGTKLVSALNTTTNASNTTGYVAQHQAEVEYKGNLTMSGAGSVGVKTANS